MGHLQFILNQIAFFSKVGPYFGTFLANFGPYWGPIGAVVVPPSVAQEKDALGGIRKTMGHARLTPL